MRLKLRIHTKILIIILTTTVVIFGASIGYVSYLARQIAMDDAKRLTRTYARQYAHLTTSYLNIDIGVTRALAQAFQDYDSRYWRSSSQRDAIYKDIQRNVLAEHPEYLSVWLHYELQFIDSSYFNDYGRRRGLYYRVGDELFYSLDTADLEGDNVQGGYYKVKTSKREAILNPYYYSYTGKESDAILETSIVVPILVNNEFIGVAGLDLKLEKFQNIVASVRPYEKSYAFLVANNGLFVAYPHQAMINESISNAFPRESNRYNLVYRIKRGQDFSFISNTKDGRQFYIALSPVNIGNTDTPWSIGIVVPVDVITADADTNFIVSLVVGAIGLFLLSIVIWITSQTITQPLQKITRILNELDKGVFDTSKQIKINTSDEISDMARSVNRLIEGLNNTAQFAKQVGEGNLDVEIKLLSKHDVLGNALLEMRKRLKEANAEEQRRQEEERRQNWATHGIAKFSEILRQSRDNMQDFAYSIISNLVKYLGVNQGGLFLLNDDDKDHPFLELEAAYAFDRRKFIEKRVDIGVNLVGRCFQESETIYMTDIPQGYMKITSGLGDENPTSLLLVPLIVNEVVYGVVEMAAFREIQPHEINFVEKIGESIASTVANMKTNLRTNQLLEESKKQSQELASKEEEMRQNMEEMQAAQEEAARREAEMGGLWGALDSMSLIMELKPDGTILTINERQQEILGLPKEKIIGKKHSNFAAETWHNPAVYQRFWENIKNGHPQQREYSIVLKNKLLWIMETCTPIYDSDDNLYKVLCIGIDITHQKNTEEELQNKIIKLEKLLKNSNLTF